MTEFFSTQVALVAMLSVHVLGQVLFTVKNLGTHDTIQLDFP